jgi:hypothetical protein
MLILSIRLQLGNIDLSCQNLNKLLIVLILQLGLFIAVPA